jgi:hypothetical protein
MTYIISVNPNDTCCNNHYYMWSDTWCLTYPKDTENRVASYWKLLEVTVQL